MTNHEVEPLNLLSAVRDIADAPNADAAINRTLGAARELLGIDGAFWMSVEGPDLVMRALSGIGRPEIMLNSSLPLSEGIGGRVASTGQPVWVADYTKYPGRQIELTQVGLNEGLCSLAAIPVQRGSQTTAVLYALNRTERTYSDAEIRILLALGAFGATVEAQRIDQDRMAADMLKLETRLDAQDLKKRAASRMTKRLAEGEPVDIVLAELSNQLGTDVELSYDATADPNLLHGVDGNPSGSQVFAVSGTAGEPETEMDSLAVSIPGTAMHRLISVRNSIVDAVYLQDLSAVLGLHLARQNAVAETEMRLQGSFIQELLTAASGQLDSLRRRQAALGVDLTQPRQVVALGQSEQVGKRALDRLSEAIRSRVPDAILASHEGRAIILWPHAEGMKIRQLLAEVILSVRPEQFTTGLGGICSSLAEYPAAVREALFAEQIARYRTTGERMVDINETGMYRIFAQVTTLTDLRTAVVAAVGELFTFDKKHGSDLVRTLRTYLENDRKLSVASRALHLHPNTLRYRIDRISRILAVDLEDPDARFFTLMALRLALEIPEIGPSSAENEVSK